MTAQSVDGVGVGVQELGEIKSKGRLASEKTFRCKFHLCNKAFTRAEHLQRHALNHKEPSEDHLCDRCNTHFKRKDLLDRHVARHKEKDDEAGGPGLGKLLTRKRFWRDPTSSIVVDKRRNGKKKARRSVSSSDSGVSLQPLVRSGEFSIDAFPSQAPPIDAEFGIAANLPLEVLASSGGDIEMSWESTPLEACDFLSNASWGTQGLPNHGGALLYDDIFAPDTASSFNMPFTTMNYYHWLFNKDAWSGTELDFPNGQELLQADGAHAPLSESIRSWNATSSPVEAYRPVNGRAGAYSQEALDRGLIPQSHDSHRFEVHAGDRTAQDSSVAHMLSVDIQTSAATQLDGQAISSSSSNGTGHSSVMSQASYGTPTSNPALSIESPFPDTRLASHGDEEQAITAKSASSLSAVARSGSMSASSSGIPLRHPPKRLPVMTEAARDGVLNFIAQARPITPNEAEIPIDHPLLSLSSLQGYSDLFFQRLNSTYPLLHQATFEPAEVDTLLLLSVLLLGATYSNKEAHLLAVCIHDILRPHIFANRSFTTRPSLWMLQTILLIECFGKSRAGQMQHDMSHLFHGLLINLIRRSDCQSARCNIDPREEISLQDRWVREVDAEQRRRLACLCFMWDTQHAVLFSQSLCMNAAELKLALPWNPDVWEAETAEEWHILFSRQRPPPPYLSLLKLYMHPRPERETAGLNDFSRVLVLYGLMSVAWDLNRRDQTSLGASIIEPTTPWQFLLTSSYLAWKADFDASSRRTLAQLRQHPERRTAYLSAQTSILSIYHCALLTLSVEIIDLQIFAGATHIIGRPVSAVDRERTRARIEKWASGLDGTKTAVCGARVLKDWLRSGETDVGSGSGGWHYPWCLYLATLAVWAFQHATVLLSSPSRARARGDAGGPAEEEDCDGDWEAKVEMSALVSAMTRAKEEEVRGVVVRYREGDLPRVMGRVLNGVRWAVVREGMIVLKGLCE